MRLQTAYFTEQKPRQLAVMSNQIGAKLKNLGVVVENAALKLFEDGTKPIQNGQAGKASAFDEFRKTLAIGDRRSRKSSLRPRGAEKNGSNV